MASTLGAAGLSAETLQQIFDGIAVDMKNALGFQTLLTGSGESGIGQLIGGFADRESAIVALAQAVYASGYLDTAEGVALDNVVALLGLLRKPASHTTGTVEILNPNPPAGPALTVTAGDTMEIVATGDRFTVDTTTAIGDGVTLPIAITAEESGPVPMPAGEVWIWSDSFPGSTELLINNAGAGSEGLPRETDPELRLRYALSVNAPGSQTLGAIRAAILELAGASECRGYENTKLLTGITSPEAITGLPGKSFVMCVKGGTPAEIRQAIFDNKPAGIDTWGTTSGAVVDDQGDSHTIEFQVATVHTLWAKFAVSGSTAAYDAAIAAACNAYADGRSVGADVIEMAMLAEAFEAAGPNVTAVSVLIDDVNPPVASGTFVIDWNRYASLPVGNVTVVHV